MLQLQEFLTRWLVANLPSNLQAKFAHHTTGAPHSELALLSFSLLCILNFLVIKLIQGSL